MQSLEETEYGTFLIVLFEILHKMGYIDQEALNDIQSTNTYEDLRFRGATQQFVLKQIKVGIMVDAMFVWSETDLEDTWSMYNSRYIDTHIAQRDMVYIKQIAPQEAKVRHAKYLESKKCTL